MSNLIQELEAKLAAANAELAALKNPNQVFTGKHVTYHSALPFIRVPIMRSPGNCDNVQFVGGKMSTNDPAVIAVMEAAIKSGGSGFSHAPISADTPEVMEMRADITKAAEIAHAKMVAAGEKTA